MPTTEPVDFDQPAQRELARRIGLAWIEIRRGAAMGVLRDLLLGTGDDALEQGQMDTLDRLANGRPWRMSDLADKLRVDPSTATRAVQRLVNAGLAARRASDDDGRVVIVEITERGRRRHAEYAVRRAELMKHLLESFEPHERPLLADFLDRFIASVDAYVLAPLHPD
jgi:DNA-binding MarR family transcriptional regulator